MKALILNSGIGSRMSHLTSHTPKCMIKISENETILSRQIECLRFLNVDDIIITTGYLSEKIREYCSLFFKDINITLVHNPKYMTTNYIYSMFLAKDLLTDDIVLMHGDLVFDFKVLEMVINSQKSCMVVSKTQNLPEKDFKVIIKNNRITKISTEIFNDAVSAQPLYKLCKEEQELWFEEISNFCEKNNTGVYAENAFNSIANKCKLLPLDIANHTCFEIDTIDDLCKIKQYLD